jgi:hypothetical protein
MDQQANEDRSNEIQTSRRRLLKAIALGGAASVVLPEKWVKPIIDAVIVPAHAQGSITVINGIYTNQPAPVVTFNPGNLMDRFAGLLISSAHADEETCALANVECLALDFSNNPDVAIFYHNGSSIAGDSTTAYPNNSVANFTVGGHSFTNVVVSSTQLTGIISCSVSNATITSSFVLPKASGHACLLAPV